MAENDAAEDTLIVSDIHLGWRFSRAEACIEIVRKFRGRRMILLGDILHRPRSRRLCRDGQAFAAAVADAVRRGIDIVLVRGNHDPPNGVLRAMFPHAVVCAEYFWRAGPVRCYAQHGHRFNRHNRYVWRLGHLLQEIPDNLHHFIQRIEGRRHRLSRFLRWAFEKILGLNGAMFRGMHEHMKERRIAADAAFCGHSHWAEERAIGGTRFFNTGSWVGHDDGRLSYIAIDELGRIEICRYAD